MNELAEDAPARYGPARKGAFPVSDRSHAPLPDVPVKATHLLCQHFGAAVDGWIRIANQLKDEIRCLDDNAFLAEKPATRFILTSMRELLAFQTKLGGLFGRRKRPPSADDFTAAVALSLEQFFAARGFPGCVRSEETTHQSRGATRPDISVRSLLGGRLLASIECKTNLGWKRKGWKEQWETRMQDLAKSFPECSSFLCVLTQVNWNSSEFINSARFGKQWFCLSTVRIGRLSDPVADSEVLSPVEPLFLEILTKFKGVVLEEVRKLPPEELEKLLGSCTAILESRPGQEVAKP